MTELPTEGEPAGPDAPQGPADGQSALVTEILRIVEPLTVAVANPLHLARLLARIGWNPAAAGEQGAADVADWLTTAAGAVGGLQQLVENPPQDLEGLGLLLDVVGDAVDLVRDVPPALADVDAAAFAEDVVHFLVTDWLLRHHAVLYHVLVLLGVLVLPEEAGARTPVVNQDGEEVRTSVARARLRPQRLVDLVTDPVAALSADYLPGGLVDEAAADALAAKLLPRLGGLLHELGVRVLVGLGETEGTGLDEASLALGRRMLTLGIPIAVTPGISGEIGATLAISSPRLRRPRRRRRPARPGLRAPAPRRRLGARRRPLRRRTRRRDRTERGVLHHRHRRTRRTRPGTGQVRRRGRGTRPAPRQRRRHPPGDRPVPRLGQSPPRRGPGRRREPRRPGDRHRRRPGRRRRRGR
ncbi:hypothetical protein ACWFR1_10595 [Streptomyces sp. NPDC055103]